MPSYLLELTPDNIEYCQKFLEKRVVNWGDTPTNLTHIGIRLSDMAYIEVSVTKIKPGHLIITLNDLDIIRVLPTGETRRIYLEDIYSDKNDKTQKDRICFN